MKRTVEELSAIIDGLDLDDETKISLMEDISDSVQGDAEDVQRQLDEISGKYIELQARYKARFTEGRDPDEGPDPDEKEEEDDIVIDVKEI